MKLWLLRPSDDLPQHENPWEPWYNKAFGFIVRAETEEEARAFANDNAGNEACQIAETNQPWNEAKYSTCVELTGEGVAEVVMMDFSRS